MIFIASNTSKEYQEDVHKELLEIAKHVSTIESERKKNLEARAGVLVGFNGLALVTLLNSSVRVLEVGIPAFNELTYDSVMFTPIVKLPLFTKLAPVISMILFLFSCICLTVSLYKFMLVIGQPRQYKSIDMKEIINLGIQHTNSLFYMKSSAIYTNALNFNRKLTENKYKDFSIASKILIISVVSLLIWYLFYHSIIVK